jgi:HSP20 family molecular chaperone IbpA
MNAENRTIRVSIGGLASSPEHAGARAPERLPARNPLIDIHEAPQGLILEADLPGASDQSVLVQLKDNVLSLEAKTTSPSVEGARLIHEEYRPGDYERSFILSDEVDRSAITAELKHGVLRICLPRSEQTKARRIEIKSQS